MRFTYRPALALALTLIAAGLTSSACGPATPTSPTAAPKGSEPTTAVKSAPAPTTPPVATVQPAQPKPTEAAAPAAKPTVSPAEDMAALYQLAKQEGEINFYTTLNTNTGQPVVEKFKARYPGIKVNYIRQSSEKLEEVMNQEAKAGKMNWDVVETNEDVMVRLLANNFLQAYTPSTAARYPSDLKDPNGMWVTGRVNPQTPSVNTHLVKPEEYPKNWSDLTTPVWKGRMAIEQGNILLFTAMKAEWGNDKALAFWKGVAANQPSIRSGNTETAQLLAAGEFPMAANIYANEPSRLASVGAPVKVIPLDPVFLQLQLIAFGAKSTHPNAAKLFINWFLDDEGQKGLLESGIVAARPDMFAQGASYLGSTRTVAIRPETAAKTPGDMDEWRAIMGIE